MSRLDRSIAVAITATIWAGLFLLVLPGRAAIVGHVWLVVVLGLALGVALGRLRRELPRRPSAFDVQFRLRPLVQTLVAGLLLQRGVDLERSPTRAEELLAPETWELVRPDRRAPDDRTAPGLPIETIERVVHDLERMSWS